jgi:GTP1/Obg family GTP-binding protein
MSNSEFISKEVIADSIFEITQHQESIIESAIIQLNRIKQSKKVTESNLHTITNIWREIDSLRDLFYHRLLHSVKRGNMVLD